MMDRISLLLKDFELFWVKAYRFLDQNFWFVVSLAVIALLWLRLPGLGQESLYLDETFSLFQSQKPIGKLLAAMAKDTNPPFYNVLLHYWMEIFGVSAASARALSVLFSLGSGIMILHISRKFLSMEAGVYSFLLYLGHNFHILYAREARTYAMVVFLSLVSLYFFLSLIQKPKTRTIIGLGITTGFLIIAHYSCYLIPLIQFSFLVLFEIRKSKVIISFIKAQVTAFVLILPWIIYFILSYKLQEKWADGPDWGHFKYVMLTFSCSTPLSRIFIWVFPMGLLSSLIYANITNQKSYFKNLVFLFFLGFGSIVLAWIFSQKVAIFGPKYLIYSSVGLILLFGGMLAMIPFPRLIKLIFILWIFNLQLADIIPQKPWTEDWNLAVPLAISEKTDGSAIMFYAWYQYPSVAYYYDRDLFEDWENTLKGLRNDHIFEVPNLEMFNKLKPEQYEKLILIRSHEIIVDPKGEIPAKALENFNLIREEEFTKIKVSVFIRKTE